MSASRDRYGRPAFRRTALAPALLAGIALLVGTLLLETETYIVFRFIVAIMALIVLVFAFQARHWWWIPVMLAIAVIWNPVFPLPIEGPWWSGAQYVAVLVFVLAGALIKVPFTDAEARQTGAKR
jgi:hypothetical protein